MSLTYEWCYEVLDSEGDIVDHHFADRLSDFQDHSITTTLCLVRNEGNSVDGLTDRHWAYVKNEQLPSAFSDSALHELPGLRVPLRFHRELVLHTIRTRRLP